jgi:hypothetical protein
MSKFLDLIVENTPDLDLDEKIAAKRAVQRCLMEKDIRCDADQRSEDIMIHLPDGRVVKLEVKEFVEVEDQENNALSKAGDNLAGIDLAVQAAEKIVGANDPRRGLRLQNPKKKVERAMGKVYSKVADNLNSALKSL